MRGRIEEGKRGKRKEGEEEEGRDVGGCLLLIKSGYAVAGQPLETSLFLNASNATVVFDF